MANIASDTFTGTSGTELHAYDANWTEHTSYSSGNLILSDANAVRRDTTNTSLYYHSATPPSADYSVSADLFAKGANGDDSNTGVCGRVSTSANTFYMARFAFISAGTWGWQLYKFVGGTPTQLGSSSTDTLADESTTNIKLEMNGTAIKLYKAGSGTATISATDSAITAAGKAGIRFAGVTAETNTTGMHITSWTADTLGVTYTLYSPTMVYSAGSWYPQVGETLS